MDGFGVSEMVVRWRRCTFVPSIGCFHLLSISAVQGSGCRVSYIKGAIYSCMLQASVYFNIRGLQDARSI